MPSHPPAEPAAQRRQRSDARANRQQLLAVAKQLFAAQGIDSTSMHEIGRTAGVGQATLYRHFADKGEICLALIKEDLAAFRERVGALMTDAQAAPLARLELLIIEKIGVTEGHLPLLTAMQDAAAVSRLPRSFRGPFDTWVHEHVVALLEQAVVEGQVAPLDILFTADAILGAVAPRHYRYQRYDLGYSSERIIAGMRYLFIERLRHNPYRAIR